MAATPSVMPSSMLTSMIWAPFSTCSRAMSSAAVKSPFLMRRRNRAEPVMLARSPMFTNRASSSITSGSRPARASAFLAAGGVRGAALEARSAKARMCSGVVPQQPPTMFTKPRSMKSPMVAAMSSGVSS